MTSINYAFLRKTGLLVVLLVALLVPFAVAYTGPVNNTASSVNDTRVDPNATIAFTVGPLLNGTTDNFVQNGFGLEFDGGTQDISISASDSLNFSLGDFSLSIWFKSTVKDTDMRFFNRGWASDGAFLIFYKANDVIEMTFRDANSVVSFGDITDNNNYMDGNWHELFVVFNRSGDCTGYIDGQLQTASVDITASNGSMNSTTDLTVSSFASRTFNGTLDEARVYSRIVGPGEIQYSFDNKVPLNQTNLEMWIDMDTNVLDQTANGNDGTLNGGPQYVRGLRGKADLVFDGTGDDVLIGDPAVLDFGTGDFSLICWINNLFADGTGKYCINKGASGNIGYGLGVRYDPPRVRASIQANGGLNQQMESLTNLTIGVDYMIAIVFDRDTQGYLYIDDTLDNSFNYLAGNNGSVTNALNLKFGEYTTGGNNFNGSIDEIRIYNRTLSSIEISEIYNGIYINNTGLVGLWNFDGNLIDTSGEGNNGSENGDPEHSDGWANVPVFTSINGRCSLANSSTGLMTLIQDAPATPANYTNINVYAATNSVLNATVPLLQVDLYNIDVGALYTELEATLQTLIYANGSSVLDGHQLGPLDTLIINGVTLTWNEYMGRFEGTVSQNTPTIITFNTLTSLNEATYGITNGNITSAPTVIWTTQSLSIILPFLRTGDWPGVILQINFILLGETIFWTLLMGSISMAIYNYSGAETAIASWILGWGIFSPVIHGQAVTISLIMIALAGGIYIAKFFLDRRTSV